MQPARLLPIVDRFIRAAILRADGLSLVPARNVRAENVCSREDNSGLIVIVIVRAASCLRQRSAFWALLPLSVVIETAQRICPAIRFHGSQQEPNLESK